MLFRFAPCLATRSAKKRSHLSERGKGGWRIGGGGGGCSLARAEPICFVLGSYVLLVHTHLMSYFAHAQRNFRLQSKSTPQTESHMAGSMNHNMNTLEQLGVIKAWVGRIAKTIRKAMLRAGGGGYSFHAQSQLYKSVHTSGRSPIPT